MYRITIYISLIYNNLITNTVWEKPPKLVNTTYLLVAKNKENQPPLNHNNSVELEPSNTKNRFINTQFPTSKSIFTLKRFYPKQY